MGHENFEKHEHIPRGPRILVPINCMLREIHRTLSILKFIYIIDAAKHDSFGHLCFGKSRDSLDPCLGVR